MFHFLCTFSSHYKTNNIRTLHPKCKNKVKNTDSKEFSNMKIKIQTGAVYGVPLLISDS